MQKTCHYCQEPFEARRSHAKYCKPAHRIAYAHAKPVVARLQARVDELALEVLELTERLKIERAYSKELEAAGAAPAENSEPEYDSEFSFD